VLFVLGNGKKYVIVLVSFCDVLTFKCSNHQCIALMPDVTSVVLVYSLLSS
jgi:hypothetical protein